VVAGGVVEFCFVQNKHPSLKKTEFLVTGTERVSLIPSKREAIRQTGFCFSYSNSFTPLILVDVL